MKGRQKFETSCPCHLAIARVVTIESRQKGGDDELAKMYDYPTHLVKLHEGDVGLFVCKPAWRGRLGTVCARWVRVNMDWHAFKSQGTLSHSEFKTRGYTRDLLVGRGTTQSKSRGCEPAIVFVVQPVTPDLVH